MLIFDIETGPQEESKILELFDPNNVKMGNTTDPVKVAAKIEEARLSFIEKAALDALTGEVVAIGVLMVDGKTADKIISGTSDEYDESKVLEDFWYRLRPYSLSRIVGFNSNQFDLPFLWRRSAILGVTVPSWVRDGRYWGKPFVDLREVWQLGDRQAKGSLNSICLAMGLPGKPNADECTGAGFHLLWKGTPEEHARAVAYLESDLDNTYGIALQLGVA